MPYKNIEDLRKHCKKYYIENKNKRIQTSKNWYKANKERILNANKVQRELNREKVNLIAKKSYYKHRDKNLIKMRKRYKENPNFFLTKRISARIRMAFNKSLAGKKSQKTLELLGCTISEFKDYIESKFKPGMSFHNKEEWHLDHIKPCCSFDLTDFEQRKECFNYTNIQPLWAAENLSKNKYEKSLIIVVK